MSKPDKYPSLDTRTIWLSKAEIDKPSPVVIDFFGEIPIEDCTNMLNGVMKDFVHDRDLVFTSDQCKQITGYMERLNLFLQAVHGLVVQSDTSHLQAMKLFCQEFPLSYSRNFLVNLINKIFQSNHPEYGSKERLAASTFAVKISTFMEAAYLVSIREKGDLNDDGEKTFS